MIVVLFSMLLMRFETMGGAPESFEKKSCLHLDMKCRIHNYHY